MSNMYISKMKRVLERFLAEQRSGNEEISRNRQYYQSDYSEQVNAQVRAKQNQQYVDAINEIEHIFDTVRGHLAKANFPDAERLTADRLIFESGMSLTPTEIRGYVERYQSTNNFTMLRIIADFIARQPQSLELNTIDIHLPAEQLEVYRWFGEEALKVLYKIHMNGLVLQQPLEVELFDDESLTTIANKLAVIGNGHGLYQYADSNVPSTALHQFDSVQLKAHAIAANLHDKES